MIRRGAAVIFISALLLGAGPTDPQGRPIYPPSDTQAELKMSIEAHMGVYLVHPPRRHRSERVQVKRKTARIDLWHPVGQTSDVKLKTRAVAWLVFGRTQYAQGARAIFSEFPQIDRVVLRLHEVIRPGQKGRRRSKKADQVKRYLALVLTRRRFERLPISALERCVKRADCSAQFRTAFTKAFFDRKYAAKRRGEA